MKHQYLSSLTLLLTALSVCLPRCVTSWTVPSELLSPPRSCTSWASASFPCTASSCFRLLPRPGDKCLLVLGLERLLWVDLVRGRIMTDHPSAGHDWSHSRFRTSNLRRTISSRLNPVFTRPPVPLRSIQGAAPRHKPTGPTAHLDAPTSTFPTTTSTIWTLCLSRTPRELVQEQHAAP